ncbi:MAG: cysteine desulfurase family protein [Bacillaceae bacterium]
MIYFDNSATTKPYEEALQSYVTVSSKYFGNPSSIHKLGVESEKLLSHSRAAVAKQLNVSPSEIVFTSGGTEGNNLAIKGTALRHRTRGRHVITTAIEHASVYEAFKQLEMLGFDVTYLPVDKDGRVSVEDIKKALREDTILLSIIHVNNEIGTIQPIKEISDLLKQYPRVLFHVDHVQGVGKVPLTLKGSNIHLCTFSGHKFHSVKGTGILYIKSGVELHSLISGGQQEGYVRSGTENLPGIVAMAKALRLSLENEAKKQKHLATLKEALVAFFSQMEDVHINTPVENAAPHILNVSFIGVKPEVMVHALEEYDVYVSTKSACSSKSKQTSRILEEMGLSEEIAASAIRISLSSENTIEEVNKFKQIIVDVLAKLKDVMR